VNGRAIWKQQLTSAPVQRFELPAGSQIIHAEVQDGIPTFWFACDPRERRLPRTFLLLPTGGPYGEEGGWCTAIDAKTHIASFFSEDREVIGHLFETGHISKEDEERIEVDLAAAGKPEQGDGWQ
jgi:hypothetical protein